MTIVTQPPAGSNGSDKDAALAPRRHPSPHARTVLNSGEHAIFTNSLVHGDGPP
jgi:hypothetical protein